MCRPYTYRICFLLTGQEYYGVCYGKKANPDTFWKNYFTSSKVVKALIQEYGVDSFEVVSVERAPLEGGSSEMRRTIFN